MSAFAPPVTLTGTHVQLEPLRAEHHDALVQAVLDGQLWQLWYTAIPTPEGMAAEIDRRLGLLAKVVFVALLVQIDVAAAALLAGGSPGDARDSGVTTISYGLWDSNQLPAYEQCAVDFEAANPQYDVVIEQIGWDDYWSKITTGFVSPPGVGVIITMRATPATFAGRMFISTDEG